MTTTLNSATVTSAEMSELAKLQSSLPKDSPLASALSTLSEGISEGVDVTVARDDDQLTPSQVGKLLGISRTHVYKLLDAGALPFHVVGQRDRRILMSDVRSYMRAVNAFRAADAKSIASRASMENDIIDSMD
ncbi:hypothetical protein BJH93_02820 [Kocuria polaris]|nr:hypothetical protein [Kocuria polaris]